MLLYDTNILVYLVRDGTNRLNEVINPNSFQEFVCEVSIGEIKSLAYQLNWGSVRVQKMNSVVATLNILSINDDLVKQTYAEIDAYSKNKHPKLTKKGSSIKMGKNDIWIASIASLVKATLVTTDNDFDHLHRVFLAIQKLSAKDFLL